MKQKSKLNGLLKLMPLILSLFVLLLCRTSHACTLEELMKVSVENRALVKAYSARFQKSLHDIKYAKGNFLPSVDLGYSFNSLGQNDITLEDKKNNRFYSGLTLNLFSGFKDVHGLDLAKKTHEMIAFELKGIKQDIKLDVGLSFLEVYYARAHLKVAEDALSLYQKEYEQVKLKYNVGLLKKNDELKLKVEMDNALQNVLRARASVSQAVNNLRFKTVTKITGDELKFSCFENIPTIVDMEYYRPLLMKNRSEIKVLTAYMENFKIRVKMARASFYPTIDLMSEYKFYDACRDGSGEETRIAVNMSVNLFDGFKKNENLKKAGYDVKKISSELVELKARLENILKNLLLDFDVSVKQLEVAKNSENEALENLRITQLSFNRGIVTSTDILDAIYYLSRAKFRLLNSRVKIFRNHFRIARMIEAL